MEVKMKNNIKRIALILLILFSNIGCNQTTKVIAKSHLESSKGISFFKDTFRFHYATNTGGFLSFGAELSENLKFWIFTILNGIFLAGMLIFLLSSNNLNISAILGFSLIVSGGIGNFIDRIYNNGAVVDFMNIGIGNIRTGIFNVADVAITVGMGFLLYINFIKDYKPKNL